MQSSETILGFNRNNLLCGIFLRKHIGYYEACLIKKYGTGLNRLTGLNHIMRARPDFVGTYNEMYLVGTKIYTGCNVQMQRNQSEKAKICKSNKSHTLKGLHTFRQFNYEGFIFTYYILQTHHFTAHRAGQRLDQLEIF